MRQQLHHLIALSWTWRYFPGKDEATAGAVSTSLYLPTTCDRIIVTQVADLLIQLSQNRPMVKVEIATNA